MGLRSLQFLAAVSFLVTPAQVASQKTGQDIVVRNPSNCVHVRIHPCGKSRCGTVVWANDKAKADSARGGTKNLVGTELFRERTALNATGTFRAAGRPLPAVSPDQPCSG
jgi:uncharacterized protein (DUF2147 family)